MALEACKGYPIGSTASRGMDMGSADIFLGQQNINHPCSSDVKTANDKPKGRAEDFGYFLPQTWIIQCRS